MGESVTDTNEQIEAEALDWTIRVQRSDFADWDALTDWMDADPRRADSFNRLSLQEEEMARLLRQVPVPSSEEARGEPVVPLDGRRVFMTRPWMLMAASFLVICTTVLGWTTWQRSGPAKAPAQVAIKTRVGEQQSIRLPDGTQIALAGATRLAVDRNGRHARLDAGRAMFSVTHDADHPFTVQIGDLMVTDVGTIFEVHSDVGRIDVAVAEGEVRVEGRGEAVSVSAGHVFRAEPGKSPAMANIDPATIGTWRRRQFNYGNATVATVATDIAAATGASIHSSPEVASKHFAGSIHVDGDVEQTLRAAAPALGVSVMRDGDDWILESPRDAAQQ